jgi:hypothetical protein
LQQYSKSKLLLLLWIPHGPSPWAQVMPLTDPEFRKENYVLRVCLVVFGLLLFGFRYQF